MSREDYESISKIIENVIGKDTIGCIKILEGLKFYLDSKEEKVILEDKKVTIVKSNVSFTNSDISKHIKGADMAMRRYTNSLKEESAEFKKQEKDCSTHS